VGGGGDSIVGVSTASLTTICGVKLEEERCPTSITRYYHAIKIRELSK
jgi:hypothetical protein